MRPASLRMILTTPVGTVDTTTIAVTEAPATSGLLAHWRADGDAVDSVGGNDGTLRAGASFSPGKVGDAFSLDGFGDYVSLPAFTTQTSLGDFTVAAWFFMEAHNPNGRSFILDTRGDGTTSQGIGLIVDSVSGNTELHNFVSFASGGFAEFNAPVPSPVGQWHHTAIVREGTTLRSYFDGEEVTGIRSGAVFKSDPISLANPKRLGTYSGAPAGGNYWFNGQIDEILVYDRALTSDQVAALFQTVRPQVRRFTRYEITFPTQSKDGDYDLAIGPDITDPAGNPLGELQSALRYSTDFEVGAGPEWDRTNTLTSAASTMFLGNFGNEAATLTLQDLPPHSRVKLVVDLVLLDSWDGNAHGDSWGFDVAGRPQPEFEHTFTGSGASQTFPGSPDVSGSNFIGSSWADAIYRDVEHTFDHSAGDLVVSFYGKNLQGLGDESWGIDNVRVFLLSPGGKYHATFTIDQTGPAITDMSPSGSVVQPFNQVEVTFDQPIDEATFTSQDIALTDVTGAPIAVSGPVRVATTTYRLTFAGQDKPGTTTLVVGPDVTDAVGNAMDQDGDGANGEATEDRFIGSIEFLDVVGPRGVAHTPEGAVNTDVSSVTVSWR